MKKTQRRVRLTVLAMALTMAVLPPGIAGAAKPDKDLKIRTTIQVVADGLDVPRGVIYDSHRHRVLVAEAGLGGPGQPQGGICGNANGGVLYCYGETGAVFEYTEYSTPRRIVTGLPSIANYSATTGARGSVLGLHDLSLHGGHLNGLFGLSGAQPFRDEQLVGGGAPGAIALGQAARILDASGNLSPYGDLVEYEQVHNPHPAIIDADPYGMYTDSHGTVVADAAGNDLLRIKPDGSIETLTVFANRDLPEFDDFIESVPTAVTRGPDGAYYVGELTGFPYYKERALVWRVVPGHEPTVYASGFTNIADIIFDNKGRLIVLEMSQEGLFANRGVCCVQPHNGDTVTGRLVRVEKNGTHTTLASSGLANPGGVAYAGSFAGYSLFYVTANTVGVGSDVPGGGGQLLRVVVRG